MSSNVKKCPYYKYCGGCNLQGFSYEQQIERKQKYFDGLLSKLHKVSKIIMLSRA